MDNTPSLPQKTAMVEEKEGEEKERSEKEEEGAR